MSEANELIEQGTDEWHAVRIGKITCSRLGELMAKTKSGYSASRENYLTEVLLEQLTGIEEQHFVSRDMLNGIETEPEARAVYEAVTGNTVIETGFHAHPFIESFGGSPDGLIGDDGMLEIKCPKARTHLETLLTKTIDRGYFLQVQGNMECTGRKWCDFVSYHPAFPEEKRMVIIRVEADPDTKAEIQREVASGLEWIEKKISALGKLK